jgi:hypothetical protein
MATLFSTDFIFVCFSKSEIPVVPVQIQSCPDLQETEIVEKSAFVIASAFAGD